MHQNSFGSQAVSRPAGELEHPPDSLAVRQAAMAHWGRWKQEIGGRRTGERTVDVPQSRKQINTLVFPGLSSCY